METASENQEKVLLNDNGEAVGAGSAGVSTVGKEPDMGDAIKELVLETDGSLDKLRQDIREKYNLSDDECDEQLLEESETALDEELSEKESLPASDVDVFEESAEPARFRYKGHEYIGGIRQRGQFMLTSMYFSGDNDEKLSLTAGKGFLTDKVNFTESCLSIYLQSPNGIEFPVGHINIFLYREGVAEPLEGWGYDFDSGHISIYFYDGFPELTPGNHFFMVDNIIVENPEDDLDNRVFMEFGYVKQPEEPRYPVDLEATIQRKVEDNRTKMFISLVSEEYGFPADIYHVQVYTDKWQVVCEEDYLSDAHDPHFEFSLEHPTFHIGGTFRMVCSREDQAFLELVFEVDGVEDTVRILAKNMVLPEQETGYVASHWEQSSIGGDRGAFLPCTGFVRKKLAQDYRMHSYLETHHGDDLKRPNYIIVTDDTYLGNRIGWHLLSTLFHHTPVAMDLSLELTNHTYLDDTELVNMFKKHPYILVNNLLSSAELYEGKLIRLLEKHIRISRERFEPHISVGLCCSAAELKELQSRYPTFMDLFLREYIFELGTMDVLDVISWLYWRAKKNGILLEDDSVDVLYAYWSRYPNLEKQTFRELENFYQDHILASQVYGGAVDGGSWMEAASPVHFKFPEIAPVESAYDKAMGELNSMVGLEHVKAQLSSLLNTIRFSRMREQAGLPGITDLTYHMIFTGSPGTGKTTVAGLLGRIFKALGILSRGEVIMTERKELVGKWIGSTEDKTKEMLDRAKGNVLFIDEAYALDDDPGSKADFGRHVIETLLTTLAKPGSDVVVILGGYRKEMDSLFRNHKGLEGRFPYWLDFPDYSAEELHQMALLQLKKLDMRLSSEAEVLLRQLVENTVKAKPVDFSNGRWVNQLVMNRLIPVMAERVLQASGTLDKDKLSVVTEEDVIQVTGKQTAMQAERGKDKNVVVGFRK